MGVDFENHGPVQSPGAENSSTSTVNQECGDTEGQIQSTSRRIRLTKHFQVDVSTRHADVLLLTCCLISGLTDSTIYNAYGTFVSMQTGNTIFVGLGGSNDERTFKPYGWVKSLTSIFCFVLGALFFSRLSRFLGPLRRTTLIYSFLLQTSFIFLTAGIIQAGVVEGHKAFISDDIDWMQEIPIALLSFQSAGQIVGSRALSLSEIPTVVVTSVLCDFASDPDIGLPLTRNVKRNRRALAFLCILIGAVVGGWLTRTTGEMQIALWMAGGIKLSIVAAWMLWPKILQKVTVIRRIFLIPALNAPHMYDGNLFVDDFPSYIKNPVAA